MKKSTIDLTCESHFAAGGVQRCAAASKMTNKNPTRRMKQK